MGATPSRVLPKRPKTTPPPWTGARTPRTVPEKASDTKNDAIIQDSKDPQLLQNLSKLGQVRVDHHMQAVRPAQLARNQLNARTRFEAETNTKPTPGSLPAVGLGRLLDERKMVRTRRDEEFLAARYGLDADTLDAVTRVVNTPSVHASNSAGRAYLAPQGDSAEPDEAADMMEAVWSVDHASMADDSPRMFLNPSTAISANMRSTLALLTLAVAVNGASSTPTVSLLTDTSGFQVQKLAKITARSVLKKINDKRLKGSEFYFGSTLADLSLNTQNAAWRSLRFEDTWNLAVAENNCKWFSNEPQEGVFNLSACNSLRDYASERNIAYRGHNTFWHSQRPDWLANNPLQFTVQHLNKTIIPNAVEAVIEGVGQKVVSWDVVNEALYAVLLPSFPP
ncbi:hypothetical protein MKEN_01182600 [Mycena kentingensis (nom. inval.)]|nr:hypothetical protein MKEN_01182600 [Mycena kentingensis (nom. inval.)]